MAKGLETVNRKLPIMLGKQINSSVITLMILLIILSSSSCAWRGRFYFVNHLSSDVLFVSYGISERNIDDYCLMKKPDTIHYRSKDDCFQKVEFRETNASGVYSTVIPPNHVLFMGRGPFYPSIAYWVAKDPSTLEVIDDLTDAKYWKFHPMSIISFRRVFVYEIVDKEEVEK